MPGPRIHVLRHGAEPPEGFVPDIDVDVTSRADSVLSPFFLGPIHDKWLDLTFGNFENYWQHLKVYRFMGHVLEDGSPSVEWYDWVAKGAELARASRYPAGRGARPEYSFWRNRRLSYVTARKLVYVPGYMRLAATTDEYTRLANEYRRGASLVLRDFDCYPRQSLTWQQIWDDPYRKAGHGFALAMMLEHGRTSYRSLLI